MKRTLAACLVMALGFTQAQSTYSESTITRTYYMDDLERCPGKLDMQTGDLWTITLPENITDSFLTRDGLVERKISDNRVIMAATGSSGSSPLLLMTENNHAPRFALSIQNGVGGRNKSVIVKAGSSPNASSCAANASAAPKVTPSPTPVNVQVVPSGAALAPKLTLPKPGAKAATPASSRTVTAITPAYLQVQLTSVKGGVRLKMTNRLEADLYFKEQDLRLAGAQASGKREWLLRGGEEVTTTVQFEHDQHSGKLLWRGVIIGSDEAFGVSANVPS